MNHKVYFFILIALLIIGCAGSVQEAWLLEGNSGTDPDRNFLATTDAQPLVVKTNDTERLRITAVGNVGIGLTNPMETLDVLGNIRTQRFNQHITMNPTLDPNSAIIWTANSAGFQNLLLDARNHQFRRSGKLANSISFNSKGLTVNGAGITIDRTPQQGIWNSRAPLANMLTTVTSFDWRGDLGGGIHPSMTIGVDGLPVIAYRKQKTVGENTSGDLQVVHCGNSDCTSGNTIVTLDDIAGFFASIVIGADGFPVIAYQDGDFSGVNLKVAKCGALDCSFDNTIELIDTRPVTGPSITIGPEGFPVISYGLSIDPGIFLLNILWCGDATCRSGNTPLTIVPAGGVSETSIAIGADGQPVISYYDIINLDLKVVKYESEGLIPVATVDASGNVGQFNSITIGNDGLPVISYYDATNRALKVVKCGDAACSDGNTITTIESTDFDFGGPTSITIGTDGFPVIAYLSGALMTDGVAHTLKVAKCGNAACSSENAITTITTIDSTRAVLLEYTSIAIGADGLPVIAYSDRIDLLHNEAVKVAKCGSTRGISYWTRR